MEISPRAKLCGSAICAVWQTLYEHPSCSFRGCIFIPDTCHPLRTHSLRLREELRQEGYLAPEVELTGFRAFNRVCATCCELLE